MLLLCIIGITIIALTSLKSTLAFYELALARMIHMQQKSAGQALALYGITLCYANQKKEEPDYTFTQWPPFTDIYQGKVIIVPAKEGWDIQTELYTDTKLLYKTQYEIVVTNNEWHVQCVHE